MSGFPTIVFVPGAWHQAACYNKVIKLLQEKHKLKCIAITLPSTTGNPAATFKDDIDAASEAISNETINGRDVVVVSHSYGGMVGNSAIKGFTRPRATAASQRSDASHTPTTGYVIGNILIASGFTFTGLAFMDPFFGRPPPTWRINSATGFADIVVSPRQMFYHDLPADEADYWVSLLTPQSLKALFEGGEFAYAGWMDVPNWYIGTIEDQGLPVAMQRMTVGMARGMGASIGHRELQTSHSPFLSQPEKTVQIMVEAVEAFTGKPVEDATAKRGRDNGIILPEARLWQPFTWVKFGLPLIFGRIMGKCVLLFTWSRRLLGFR
ncbi:pyrethroid hydrolase [Trichoderma arundinaceum]|uniref:Pyrethroid hydrolase n=1 Tax=Trichoderma arundinaceum TaxID=490622 RepID=A0A395NI28_TRIAR|nr:pyrethroid hydrolase [Trichoderma arundinaceum]